MSKSFTQAIGAAVRREFSAAKDAQRRGEHGQAFHHLENAHILGQRSTYWHSLAHLHMLRWGWRQKRVVEVLGQLVRLVAATTKTGLGWVPEGNTGGTNVSPFRAMPLSEEHAAEIAQARAASRRVKRQ